MLQPALRVVSITLGGLLLSACAGTSAFTGRSELSSSQPLAQITPASTRTPSGIFISTQTPPTATPGMLPGSKTVIVQGRVFDAGSGQRLNNATVEWQFLALDQQPHNGQLQVPADGLYRLELPIRSKDEVIITARAPGHVSSLARLHGSQLSPYGSRLNFGLVADNGPAPTLPGALGTIQMHGIVYNVARGLQGPIAQAELSVVNRSLVQPVTRLAVTASPTGTFHFALPLHTTDQIEFTIAANGYLTTTLTRSAKELARYPQLSIGLRPAPK